MNRIDGIKREITNGTYPRHSNCWLNGIEVSPLADAEALLGRIAALEECIRKIKATANGPITWEVDGKQQPVDLHVRADVITNVVNKLAAEAGVE